MTKIIWWENGDHPDDNVGEELYDPMSESSYRRLEGAVVRFYRNPDPEYAGQVVHGCGYTFHQHGWIDRGGEGVTVCPGDLVDA